jgi:hypothetical protein
MTMQHPIHPDDERLSALAGGDADAMADAGLRAHVAACDRCAPALAELQGLRAALAELPDLVPSRPLQLVPPVPAAAAATTGSWLRRLAAPFMAAGVVLVLVGAVGGSGALTAMNFGAAGAAASAGDQAEVADHGASPRGPAEPGATRAPGYFGGQASARAQATDQPPARDSMMPAPTTDDTTTGSLSGESSEGSPWLVVLFAGVGLLLAGVLVRLVPRAGP